MPKPLITVDPSTGWMLAALIVVPVVVHTVARIIDPAAVRRWDAKHWHRFSRGMQLPDFLNADILSQSRARRVMDRLNAIIFLGFLCMVLAAAFVFSKP